MSFFVTKNNPTDLWLSSKVVNDAYDRFRGQADVEGATGVKSGWWVLS
jgi:hypothetical protein